VRCCEKILSNYYIEKYLSSTAIVTSYVLGNLLKVKVALLVILHKFLQFFNLAGSFLISAFFAHTNTQYKVKNFMVETPRLQLTHN